MIHAANSTMRKCGRGMASDMKTRKTIHSSAMPNNCIMNNVRPGPNTRESTTKFDGTMNSQIEKGTIQIKEIRCDRMRFQLAIINTRFPMNAAMIG